MKSFINNSIFFIIILLFDNCASIGNPPGGELDTAPPKFIKAIPAKNSLNIHEKQSIQIIFDELLNPATITSAIKIEPSTKIISKVFGNKIIIQPVTSWNEGSFKIIISRSLSDYSFKKNKLLSSIEILYSTSNNLYSKIVSGSIVNSDSSKTYDVAVVDDKLNIVSLTQTDQKQNFSLSLLNKLNSNLFFVAVENKISDNLILDIRKNSYAISSNYINDKSESLYISNPIYRNYINTVKLINNNFGLIILNNGNELPFVLNNNFFQGLINQIDNFYYFDYTYQDSLFIKVNLENQIEKYFSEINIMLNNNIIDTVSPEISNHYILDTNYRLYFNEPILVDNKNIFLDLENSKNISFKYISPLELQLNSTNFNSLQIDCKSIKDLNNNYMCDSISIINKIDKVQNEINSWGEINGIVDYNGNKKIIVEVTNINNGESFSEILKDNIFLFNKLPPGNYKIWCYENINKINNNYFSGKLEPLELAAKFMVYDKLVAVRSNWKNTINLKIK